MHPGLITNMSVGLLILAAVLLVFFAVPLSWIRWAREQGKSLFRSETWRRRLMAAAAAFYLILFVYHLLWPEMLAPFLVWSVLVIVFFASQVFWFRRIGELGEKLISSRTWRGAMGAAAVGVYLFLFVYNFFWARRWPTTTSMNLRAALLEAPFYWWMVGSMLGLAVVILISTADRLVRSALWIYRKAVGARRAVPLPNPVSPDRRRFLEQTAIALSAAPFVAGAYGLLYGRLNLETARKRIRLSRLPGAFRGFRIAQLSDIHIGPFMSETEIRKYVAITNELRPDLVVLTGDFVTWDPKTQGAVVEALAGLKAPFGVFGCLGNHELWTETEDSITRLFVARGIRILRQQSAQLHSSGEKLNLIGVDFQSVRGWRPRAGQWSRKYLYGIEKLLVPDTANILLSHNPNAFDRAAELEIDLTVAGHTHGGQVTLEFIHPSLSPSRLITDYVKGWFEKNGAQLYVNRGIGTFGVPIRLNAPPEITVFELFREG